MLRRLSPKSQQIVDEAQNIARRYEQEYVDAEHMLLAIAEKNDNRAAQALQQCGATAQKLRKNLEKVVKQHVPETFVLGRLPATLHLRNVIARAVELAEKRVQPPSSPSTCSWPSARKAARWPPMPCRTSAWTPLSSKGCWPARSKR